MRIDKRYLATWAIAASTLFAPAQAQESFQKEASTAYRALCWDYLAMRDVVHASEGILDTVYFDADAKIQNIKKSLVRADEKKGIQDLAFTKSSWVLESLQIALRPLLISPESFDKAIAREVSARLPERSIVDVFPDGDSQSAYINSSVLIWVLSGGQPDDKFTKMQIETSIMRPACKIFDDPTIPKETSQPALEWHLAPG